MADKSGPIAIEADSVATFARDLRMLRANAGLDYPDMAEKSHYTMRTLASAAGGLRLPTLPVLIAFVQACNGDVSEWEDRWAKLGKSKKGMAALPAAGEDAASSVPGPDHRPGAASGGPHGAGPGETGPGGPDPDGTARSNEVYVITSAKPRDAHW
jgi:hypothetical protein